MLDSKPLITTIIPTYRRPKLLRRAIRSVLQQTYPDLRISVYDNDSGDETAAVVSELAQLDHRIHYYCRQENIGAFNNFQYALKDIQTEFFSILCDDDILCPEFYETAMKWFDTYPEAEFVSMGVLNVNAWGDIFPDGTMAGCRIGLYRPFDGLMTMLLHTPPTWTGTLFRKSILSEVGFLDEAVGPVGDMDFMLRAASKVSFVYDSKKGGIFIPAPLAKAGSIRGSSIEGILPGWHKIIQNITDNNRMPDETIIQVTSILTARMKLRILQMGIAAILRGDYNASRKASEALRSPISHDAYSKFLFFTTKMCERSSILHQGILKFYHARSLIRRLKQIHSGKRYAEYSLLLKI
jgi:glycosyltransferase involved in cell wall biosynthesis